MTEDPVLRQDTPLLERHQELGAVFTDFAGWRMPVRYTSDVEEHRAVRERAGLFDLSHMAEIEISGPEAATALDAALVGWISKVPIGKAKYTMMCDSAGGVIDDLVVYRIDAERFLVVANAANREIAVARFMERCSTFDALVTDVSDSFALLAVQGPASAEILGELSTVDLTPVTYYSIVQANIHGLPTMIARTGYTGEDGFELYVDAVEAPQIWDAVIHAGEPHGLRPAGLACRDTLRLEAGMPLYGHELTERTTPFEAGLGRIVAFGKPVDFFGREALEAALRAPATRSLVGLSLPGRRAARAQQLVFARGTDEPVGVVTSGAPSPTLGRPIALAYVDNRYAGIDTELTVDVRGRHEVARVVALPFYRR